MRPCPPLLPAAVDPVLLLAAGCAMPASCLLLRTAASAATYAAAKQHQSASVALVCCTTRAQEGGCTCGPPRGRCPCSTGARGGRHARAARPRAVLPSTLDTSYRRVAVLTALGLCARREDGEKHGRSSSTR
jgi:hypothetical protein